MSRWAGCRAGGGAVGVGGLILLAAISAVVLGWPRYAAERERGLGAARAMAHATLPSAAVDGAREEVQPTAHGWRVVFRGVNVPCAQTHWACRTGPAQSPDETLIYQDAWVCVEYGTGRAYIIVGTFRPAGRARTNTCAR